MTASGGHGAAGAAHSVAPWAILAGALAFAAAAVLASPGVGGMGGDDAEYVLLARAIRERGAYVSTWAPGEPTLHTLYPPVLPLLLAPFVGAAGNSLVGVHLVLAASGGAAVALLTMLFARRGLPPAAAAFGALATAFSPVWLRCASDVLSELPFLAFAAGALVALEHGPEGRLPARRAFAAAGLAALAFLTRTAGIALLPWVVLGCIGPRRGAGRAGWIASAALAAAVVSWFVYGAVAGGGGTYLGVLSRGESSAGVAATDPIAARAWTALRDEYLPGLPSLVFPSAGTIWDGCGWALWGLAGAGIVAGVVRTRRLRAAEGFALTTLALLCVWQFRDPRFGVPLVPLFAGFALEGLHAAAVPLRDGVRRAAVVAVAAAIVLPNAHLVLTVTYPRAFRATPPVAGAPAGLRMPDVARFHDTWTLDDAAFPGAAGPIASYLLLCEAIRTDPSAPPGPVLASNPRVAALLTGRASLGAGAGESPDAVISRMRAAGADLLLVDSFIDPRSSAVREIVRRRGEDLVQLGSVGESYLLRLRPAR